MSFETELTGTGFYPLMRGGIKKERPEATFLFAASYISKED
jgi:hypothetical protein